MTDWSPGVVLTASASRLDNLKRVLPILERIMVPYYAPQVICVLDGEDAWPLANELFSDAPETQFVFSQKHRPGMEQPRNLGVRALSGHVKQVWFVDSDILFRDDALEFYRHAWELEPRRVMIGPYDWGGPDGQVEQPDPRNAAFELYNDTDTVSESTSTRGEILGAGLACFGGNLVWPRDLFEEIGGFHPELHHGRCEDGELGLRAVEHGVPMCYVKGARGFHLWHPRNMKWILDANTRDVPILNRLHPWVQNDGLRVVPEDGLRFNFVCPVCEDSVNTGEYWSHYASH